MQISSLWMHSWWMLLCIPWRGKTRQAAGLHTLQPGGEKRLPGYLYFSKIALVYPIITPMVIIMTAHCVSLLSQKPLMSYRHYILIRYLHKPVVSLCFHVVPKLQWIKKLPFRVWMFPTSVGCASQGDNTFSRLKPGIRTLSPDRDGPGPRAVTFIPVRVNESWWICVLCVCRVEVWTEIDPNQRARGIPKDSLSAQAVPQCRTCVKTFKFSHYQQGDDGSVRFSANCETLGKLYSSPRPSPPLSSPLPSLEAFVNFFLFWNL